MKFNFEKLVSRAKSYDGISVGYSGISVPNGQPMKPGMRYDVYIDKENKAIQILENKNGRYKFLKHVTNTSGMINAGSLKNIMPNGRYYRDETDGESIYIFGGDKENA